MNRLLALQEVLGINSEIEDGQVFSITLMLQLAYNDTQLKTAFTTGMND